VSAAFARSGEIVAATWGYVRAPDPVGKRERDGFGAGGYVCVSVGRECRKVNRARLGSAGRVDRAPGKPTGFDHRQGFAAAVAFFPLTVVGIDRSSRTTGTRKLSYRTADHVLRSRFVIRIDLCRLRNALRCRRSLPWTVLPAHHPSGRDCPRLEVVGWQRAYGPSVEAPHLPAGVGNAGCQDAGKAADDCTGRDGGPVRGLRRSTRNATTEPGQRNLPMAVAFRLQPSLNCNDGGST